MFAGHENGGFKSRNLTPSPSPSLGSVDSVSANTERHTHTARATGGKYVIEMLHVMPLNFFRARAR